MQLFPKLGLTLYGGWIYLLIFGIVFGGVVKSFPKEVIARLYDTSNWTPAQRTLTRIGKAFSVVITVLVALTPLTTNTPVFWLGTAIFGLGLGGLVLALFNFRNTPTGQPITQGLYKRSRNPQWMMLIVMFLGQCIVIGSWTAFVLFLVTIVCYHFRILGEERACLAQYGDAYRDYMQRIPRYFLFF